MARRPTLASRNAAAERRAQAQTALPYQTVGQRYQMYNPPRSAGGGARPASPPAGYYDTSIDSQVRAGERGLQDLLGQQTIAGARGENDRNIAIGDIYRDRDTSLADMLTNFNRGNQQFDWQADDLRTGWGREQDQFGWQRNDLDTGQGRAMADSELGEGRMREDYGTALTNLDRGYRRLGGNQAQALSSAGLSGGAFAQAAGKRAENMAIDRAPIDTGFNRGLADLLTNRTRTTEDYGTNVGRLDRRIGWSTDDYATNTGRLGTQRGWAADDYRTNYDRTWDAADRGVGAVNLGWTRQVEDWKSERDVAQREQGFFGQDANNMRWQQASQAGFAPGRQPAKRRP